MDRARAKAIEENRDLWDKRVRAHLAHGLYPSASVEAGTYEIGEPDTSEVGDVTGLRLLHLQCNAGADTLAWARRGATVTGVDFSAEAIAEARRLAAVTGLDATFVCADVYDLPADLGPFEIVYSSMGVLWWLPDLDRWAAAIAKVLAPGGRFHLSEIHPFAGCLVDRDDHLAAGADYFGSGTPISFTTSGTYYDAPEGFAAEPGTENGWLHSLGEVVTALCGAGLHIDFLHEHAFTHFRMLPSFARRDDGTWGPPAGGPTLPLTFTLQARAVGAADG